MMWIAIVLNWLKSRLVGSQCPPGDSVDQLIAQYSKRDADRFAIVRSLGRIGGAKAIEFIKTTNVWREKLQDTSGQPDEFHVAMAALADTKDPTVIPYMSQFLRVSPRYSLNKYDAWVEMGPDDSGPRRVAAELSRGFPEHAAAYLHLSGQTEGLMRMDADAAVEIVARLVLSDKAPDEDVFKEIWNNAGKYRRLTANLFAILDGDPTAAARLKPGKLVEHITLLGLWAANDAEFGAWEARVCQIIGQETVFRTFRSWLTGYSGWSMTDDRYRRVAERLAVIGDATVKTEVERFLDRWEPLGESNKGAKESIRQLLAIHHPEAYLTAQVRLFIQNVVTYVHTPDPHWAAKAGPKRVFTELCSFVTTTPADSGALARIDKLAAYFSKNHSELLAPEHLASLPSLIKECRMRIVREAMVGVDGLQGVLHTVSGGIGVFEGLSDSRDNHAKAILLLKPISRGDDDPFTYALSLCAGREPFVSESVDYLGYANCVAAVDQLIALYTSAQEPSRKRKILAALRFIKSPTATEFLIKLLCDGVELSAELLYGLQGRKDARIAARLRGCLAELNSASHLTDAQGLILKILAENDREAIRKFLKHKLAIGRNSYWDYLVEKLGFEDARRAAQEERNRVSRMILERARGLLISQSAIREEWLAHAIQLQFQGVDFVVRIALSEEPPLKIVPLTTA
jgi:hypothetical protein